jgi:REP element-mobilizing transposase RayT
MSEAYKTSNPESTYFLTFQVVFWLDVFTRKAYRDIFIESLKYCRKHKEMEVFAFVIMSNHVHLILRNTNRKLADTIRDLKKYTANQIINLIDSSNESRRKWLLSEMAFAARKHNRNSNYQLWTHENHAIELINGEMLEQRLNYIHQNPVRAGIVEKAEDYLYSSARNYCKGLEVIMEIDLSR